MIEALAIGGGATTLVLVIVLAVSFRWGMKAKDAEAAVRRELAEQIRQSDEALRKVIGERNDLQAKYDVSTQALAAAKTRLAIAETQRNRAALEERERVVQEIRAADPARAADLVNRILSAELPQVRSAPAGDGDRGVTGVQAAAAPSAADQAGRVPEP